MPPLRQAASSKVLAMVAIVYHIAMSEMSGSRPEIDKIHIDDWFLSFTVISSGADSSIESVSQYAGLITSMPPETVPMFSLEEGEVIFTMQVSDATQERALFSAYENLVSAFEAASQPMVLRAARVSCASEVRDAMTSGSQLNPEDVSLEMIDLERWLDSVRDIE